MSRWKTAFDNQQASAKIGVCQDLLASGKIDDFPPQTLEEYHRLLKALKIIQSRLKIIDPELFRENTWGNFSNWLNAVQSHISNFNQNRSVAHLQNANNVLDEVLSLVRPAASDSPSQDIMSLTEANSQFTAKIVEELDFVKKRSQEVKAQLDALSVAVTQAKARLTENDTVIQQQKGRLDQSINDFQKQFSEAQEKRRQDFSESLKKASDEVLKQRKECESQDKQAVAQRKKEYESFLEDIRKQSNAHLGFLNTRQDEVNKIFGAIGSSAFAGNFKLTADKEAGAANLWRWIALVLMSAMIGVGGYAFYYSIGHETDWRVFLFRLGTVIVLAIPAIYAANESSKHRQREVLNRKVHLELAAIDAYLVLLPEDQRNKIKGSLAEKFFGVPIIQDKTEEVSKKDMFGLVSSVVSNLTKGK